MEATSVNLVSVVSPLPSYTQVKGNVFCIILHHYYLYYFLSIFITHPLATMQAGWEPLPDIKASISKLLTWRLVLWNDSRNTCGLIGVCSENRIQEISQGVNSVWGKYWEYVHRAVAELEWSGITVVEENKSESLKRDCWGHLMLFKSVRFRTQGKIKNYESGSAATSTSVEGRQDRAEDSLRDSE